jgi:hypothetical protein
VLDLLDRAASFAEQGRANREVLAVDLDAAQANRLGHAPIALAMGGIGDEPAVGARERLDRLFRALKALAERGRFEPTLL